MPKKKFDHIHIVEQPKKKAYKRRRVYAVGLVVIVVVLVLIILS